jgi:hypothetical protein
MVLRTPFVIDEGKLVAVCGYWEVDRAAATAPRSRVTGTYDPWPPLRDRMRAASCAGRRY